MKRILVIMILLFTGFSSAYSQFGRLGDAARSAAGALGIDGDKVDRAIAVASAADAARAANNLTPENEYYLGRAVAANIAGTYKIYNNAALQNYLNKICYTIVINSPKPDLYNGYHVAILDTDEINAFATPGGHIFVTRGLIACASSEDALAAVIAHEIAHIQLRHALTSIRNARYVNAAISGALAGIGDSGNTKELAGIMGDSVNEVITTLVVNGFSSSQELEADTAALSLLASAGYQPSGLVEMLQVLKEKQQGGQGFGKTHPTPDARIANVNKNLGKYKVEDTRSFRTKRYTDIRR
ncbi:MAG: M48 family metalloprotease [Treponema sp.]|nr:M48 family metalloprotease [Treponema sp.]